MATSPAEAVPATRDMVARPCEEVYVGRVGRIGLAEGCYLCGDVGKFVRLGLVGKMIAPDGRIIAQLRSHFSGRAIDQCLQAVLPQHVELCHIPHGCVQPGRHQALRSGLIIFDLRAAPSGEHELGQFPRRRRGCNSQQYRQCS